MKPIKNLAVCHVNVRSLLAQTRLLDLEILSPIHNVDILCLSETWLSATRAPTSASIPLPGYQVAARRDRLDRRGGGVVIFARNELSVTPLLLPPSLCIECTGVQLSLTRRRKLNILFAYRPPNSSMVDFLEELDTVMSSACCLGNHPLCLVGDFNCKSKLWWSGQNSCADGRLLESFAQEHALSQVVDGPTHDVSGTSPSLLDLIFLSQPQSLKNMSILPPLSDHSPTVAQLDLQPPCQRPVIAFSWDYAHADWESLRKLLANADWSPVLKSNNVDSALTAWSEVFVPVVRACVPKRRICLDGGKPWYSPFLHRLARCRDRLFKRSRGLVNCHPTAQAFGRVCNWYVRELRYAERLYYRRTCMNIYPKEMSRRPHHWWNQVKSLCGLRCRGTIPTLSEGVEISVTPDEKAEALNHHFASQCSAASSESLPMILPSPKPLFKFAEFTPSEVEQHLNNLDSWKAPGVDDISNRLLKECRVALAEPLCTRFNLSLSQGFLGTWKQAIIQPIFKQKGNRWAPVNDRPIALLPSIAKVLETLVRKQLLRHCLKEDCLPDQQFGFLPHRSTVWQLLSVLEDWSERIDRGEAVHALFLDVAKAFDRVDHGLMAVKLASIGVQDQELRWFTSYLRGRTICTTVERRRSSPEPISSGVPQGSVLGPLLFIIYFGDLPQAISATSCLFADDTLAYDRCNALSCNCRLKEDVENVDSWAKTWNTTFNAAKSVEMVVSRKRQQPVGDGSLLLGGVEVPRAGSTKHLGVIVSAALSWSDHVSSLITKAAPLCGLLKRLALRCPGGSSHGFLKMIYLSLIRPRLEYASPVWGSGCSHADAAALERLQGSVARAIYRSAHGNNPTIRLRSKTALTWLNLPTLAWRRRRAALVLLWRLINGEGPPQLRRHLPLPASKRCTYSLRNADMSFEFPVCNTTKHLSSFLPSSLALFSTLPHSVVSSTSLPIFIHRLDEHFQHDKFSFLFSH